MENNKKDDDKIVTYLITKLEELLKNYQFDRLASSIFDIEVFDVDVYSGDDYYKMPKNSCLKDIKDKMKELGSHSFVTKEDHMIYIRSPPSEKNGRDIESIREKANELILSGKDYHGWKTYLYKY